MNRRDAALSIAERIRSTAIKDGDGLYWYTALAYAKHASQATGRPILSLRLLGTLDTEYSCANSRFFRTALYANENVSKYLRLRKKSAVRRHRDVAERVDSKLECAGHVLRVYRVPRSRGDVRCGGR